MSTTGYQEYMDELARGDSFGIFIDDTGSPGITNAPENYHPERKTWVAVIVPISQISEVMNQMPKALDELKSLLNAEEFHFTEIYSGTKNFKNIDLQSRLSLFRFMASIFSTYKFPVIVQTFDPETLADVRSQAEGQIPDSLLTFNLNDCSDSALFFLLLRLKKYMEGTETFGKVKARVFIDEGFKKNGAVMKIPNFGEVFAESQICFASSSVIYPIQLADFAAFSLNRSQLVGGRKKRGALDNELLRILSPLVFNFINIEKKEIPIDQDGAIITLDDTRPNELS